MKTGDRRKILLKHTGHPHRLLTSLVALPPVILSTILNIFTNQSTNMDVVHLLHHPGYHYLELIPIVATVNTTARLQLIQKIRKVVWQLLCLFLQIAMTVSFRACLICDYGTRFRLFILLPLTNIRVSMTELVVTLWGRDASHTSHKRRCPWLSKSRRIKKFGYQRREESVCFDVSKNGAV